MDRLSCFSSSVLSSALLLCPFATSKCRSVFAIFSVVNRMKHSKVSDIYVGYTRLIAQPDQSISRCLFGLPGDPQCVTGRVHALLFCEPRLLLDCFNILVLVISSR